MGGYVDFNQIYGGEVPDFVSSNDDYLTQVYKAGRQPLKDQTRGGENMGFRETAAKVTRKPSTSNMYVFDHDSGCENPNYSVIVEPMAEFGDVVSLTCPDCKVKATLGFVSKGGYVDHLPKT